MSKYVLSPQAQKSIRKIKSDSIKRFRRARTTLYLQHIQLIMQEIADNPSKGEDRATIKAGYFSVSVNSHIIFYRVVDNVVQVIDVLHKRMDHMRHL